ncbi:unnamed protein product [Notodromas monacha]|uniref:Uncharacterized protein n=1 Tax=Notodromas monacha TaxID=399045 RepID=A0A7R9BWV0_9CRUS|nr:unnamed protein product [Notodromas monacha]CAG0922075.1 unnamed protein product [Notodromas monacha]
MQDAAAAAQVTPKRPAKLGTPSFSSTQAASTTIRATSGVARPESSDVLCNLRAFGIGTGSFGLLPNVRGDGGKCIRSTLDIVPNVFEVARNRQQEENGYNGSKQGHEEVLAKRSCMCVAISIFRILRKSLCSGSWTAHKERLRNNIYTIFRQDKKNDEYYYCGTKKDRDRGRKGTDFIYGKYGENDNKQLKPRRIVLRKLGVSSAGLISSIQKTMALVSLLRFRRRHVKALLMEACTPMRFRGSLLSLVAGFCLGVLVTTSTFETIREDYMRRGDGVNEALYWRPDRDHSIVAYGGPKAFFTWLFGIEQVQEGEGKRNQSSDTHTPENRTVIPDYEMVRVQEGNDSVADELSRRVRVLCWIMTQPENHQKKAIHVKATWGKRCNVLLFMSTADERVSNPILTEGSKDEFRQIAKTRLCL